MVRERLLHKSSLTLAKTVAQLESTSQQLKLVEPTET